MPTYNRRAFIPNAINYFRRQDYINKELIILDDGSDPITDLIPDSSDIRYFRLDKKISLGAKLNLGCGYSKGEIIVNWDDDDWYASRRIKYQVAALQNKNTEICGINHLFYYDIRTNQAYQYIYPSSERKWLLGSSLCYTKDVWTRNPFVDINVGMDALFVWSISPDRVLVLGDSKIAVHMIHNDNISPKETAGGWWHTYPVEEIQKIIDADHGSVKSNTYPSEDMDVLVKNDITKRIDHKKPLTNIYACLVHENEDCIIDLVRNLHHNDPSSTILLYNGSEQQELIQKHFPYDKFGVVIHPDPVSVKHGYLHTYALKCMEYAVDNFNFDILTFVDSDQLSIRPGYSEYMSAYLATTSNVGLLSSKPRRIVPEDADNIELWPAIQAFKEFDLWRPFLQTFPGGESTFVHWTFWPSTVLTASAVNDLLHLFRYNKQLQEIMSKTKIWATEEIIFPTLVKLLGYEIASNPCNYEYVKYRKRFTEYDVRQALHKTDAFWIHPVDRKYDDTNRKMVRTHFREYTKEGMEEAAEVSSVPILPALPLIKSLTGIEGWLADAEADLLMSIAVKACHDLSLSHNIVEVGSYHGKSTIIFGSVVKVFCPEGKVYAIDTHDGQLGAADQGMHSFPPSLESFKQNIHAAGIDDKVEIIRDKSVNVEWHSTISLLFIDGLHDYANVARDFWHFSDWIRPGGFAAFHDYADYFPGVMAFVNELLGMGTFKKVRLTGSLFVMQKL